MRFLAKLLTASLILFASSFGMGQEEETPWPEDNTPSAFSFGHLVTSNSQVLAPNDFTVGTLIIAYGVTDFWTVGVSPLAIFNFNMLNLHNRFAFEWNEEVTLGFEHTYFKNYNKGYNTNRARYTEEEINFNPKLWQSFKMEAHALKATATVQWTLSYRGSFSFSFFKYIDDDRPFSLRMDPQNSDDYAASLTSLHEFLIHEKFQINTEFGFWGMNYTYPYLHGGFSLQFIEKSFVLGMGMSATYSPTLPESKVRPFGPGYTNRVSYHPEVQIQLFL